MGGDIDCDFKYSSSPIPSPITTTAPNAPPQQQAPVAAPAAAPTGGSVGSGGGGGQSGTGGTPAPTVVRETEAPVVPPVREKCGRLRSSPCGPCEFAAVV